MKRTLIVVSIMTLFISSCKIFTPKMTCNNEEAVSMVAYSVRNEIIQDWALKLAAEDYKSYKSGFFEEINSTYKNYLKEKYNEIKNNEGKYYNDAVEQYSNNQVELVDITPTSYDKDIDKCECSATIKLTNTESTNKVTFDNERTTDGKVTGHFKYSSHVKIDDMSADKVKQLIGEDN